MRRAIKERLTFANVISMVALFVALGGVGAYAADKLGSKDIERNAIKSKHIKDDRATGEDVNEDSLGTVPRASFANDAAELDGIPAFFYQLGNGFDTAIAGFIDDGESGAYLALGGDVQVDCDSSPTVVWDDLGGDGGTVTDLWMGGQYQEVADGGTSTARAFDTTLSHEVQAWAGDDTISLVHVSVVFDTVPTPDECRVAFTAQEHFSLGSPAQAQAARERAERDGRGGATGLRGR